MDGLTPMQMPGGMTGGIQGNLLLGQLINQITGQQAQSIPNQGSTTPNQQGLSDIMSQSGDAFLKGMLGKMKEHGENAAPAMTSAIIQQLLNPGVAMAGQAIANPGGQQQMQPPPPPQLMTAQQQVAPQQQQQQTMPSTTAPTTPPNTLPPSNEGKKKGDWAGALIGLGAGLQGKDVGEAINSYLKSKGQEPVQPFQKQQQNIQQFQALVQLSNDQALRLTNEITANAAQIQNIQKNFPWYRSMGQKGENNKWTLMKKLYDKNTDLTTQLNTLHTDMGGLFKNPPTQQGGQGKQGTQRPSLSADQLNIWRSKGAIGYDDTKGVFVDAQGNEVK